MFTFEELFAICLLPWNVHIFADQRNNGFCTNIFLHFSCFQSVLSPSPSFSPVYLDEQNIKKVEKEKWKIFNFVLGCQSLETKRVCCSLPIAQEVKYMTRVTAICCNGNTWIPDIENIPIFCFILLWVNSCFYGIKNKRCHAQAIEIFLKTRLVWFPKYAFQSKVVG